MPRYDSFVGRVTGDTGVITRMSELPSCTRQGLIRQGFTLQGFIRQGLMRQGVFRDLLHLTVMQAGGQFHCRRSHQSTARQSRKLF